MVFSPAGLGVLPGQVNIEIRSMPFGSQYYSCSESGTLQSEPEYYKPEHIAIR